MNLSMTMTEKDKKLLLIVGVAGFLVLFITFVFVPSLSARQEAVADLADAEARRTEMEYNIALDPSAQQNAVNAAGDLATVCAQYYGLMQNEDLDTLVTGLTLSHNLTPLTLNIASVTPQSLTGYVGSAKAGQTAAVTAGSGAAAAADTAEGSTDSTATAGADTALAANLDFLYTATVSVTSAGSREDFVALLDDLSANYPAIQLVSFNITDSAYLTQDSSVQTSSTFSYTLNVYLCNKEGLQ